MSDEQPKSIRQLDGARFKGKEYETVDYWATVEEGTTRAEMKNPAFWAHVAAKLTPYSFIHIRCDDGTFYAKGIVLQVDRTWAVVHLLEWHNLTTKDVAQTQAAAAELGTDIDAFDIVHKGQHKKWCVIRRADQMYVAEGKLTRAEATVWLAEHVATAKA